MDPGQRIESRKTVGIKESPGFAHRCIVTGFLPRRKSLPPRESRAFPQSRSANLPTRLPEEPVLTSVPLMSPSGRPHLFADRIALDDGTTSVPSSEAVVQEARERDVPLPEAEAGRVEVTPAEMAAILEGIDLSRARRQPRFVLPAPQPA